MAKMTKKKSLSKQHKQSGRFSNKLLDEIQNRPDLSDEDLSLLFKKTPEAIGEKRAELEEKNRFTTEDKEVLYRLKGSYLWGPIKKLLFQYELELFEQEWVKLHGQFASQGVLHTDEIMMKDLILHEIMAQRAAEQKKKNLSAIELIQRKINAELKKGEDKMDSMLISNLEMQRSNLQAMVGSLTKEHLEYQKKKDEKLEQLKATRSQRLKQAEMSGKNIWEMIKELDRPEMRRKFGKYMQKMRLSSDQIREQWKESMEYEDGHWDQPLISPDNTTTAGNVNEKLPRNEEEQETKK